jgi:hypothetical protein
MRHRTIAIGDGVRFNYKAAPWTHGLLFTVSEIKVWGIEAWTKGAKPGEAVVAINTAHHGQAGYRAEWAEIERVEKR